MLSAIYNEKLNSFAPCQNFLNQFSITQDALIGFLLYVRTPHRLDIGPAAIVANQVVSNNIITLAKGNTFFHVAAILLFGSCRLLAKHSQYGFTILPFVAASIHNYTMTAKRISVH